MQFPEAQERVAAAFGNEKRTVRNILRGSLGVIRRCDPRRSRRQEKLQRGARKQPNLTEV
jgi:hypothetical protein